MVFKNIIERKTARRMNAWTNVYKREAHRAKLLIFRAQTTVHRGELWIRRVYVRVTLTKPTTPVIFITRNDLIYDSTDNITDGSIGGTILFPFTFQTNVTFALQMQNRTWNKTFYFTRFSLELFFYFFVIVVTEW